MQIIKQLITFITKPIIFIPIVTFIALSIYYNKLRGMIGEFWVRQKLKKLSKEDYKVLNNVMISLDGKTHQIDHIVISKYGIFVIEMKNYYGRIYGNDYENKWIQYIGRYKNYFLNPIHQNYGHVKTLEELLNLNNEVFIPIVCFSNQVKLKVDCKTNVVRLNRLNSTILGQQNIVLDSDINEIYDKISELNITDKRERKNHVKNIRYRIKEDNDKVKNMICPKCGGHLILRKGKNYKPFIGCSNYPYCRFTKRK